MPSPPARHQRGSRSSNLMSCWKRSPSSITGFAGSDANYWRTNSFEQVGIRHHVIEQPDHIGIDCALPSQKRIAETNDISPRVIVCWPCFSRPLTIMWPQNSMITVDPPYCVPPTCAPSRFHIFIERRDDIATNSTEKKLHFRPLNASQSIRASCWAARSR